MQLSRRALAESNLQSAKNAWQSCRTTTAAAAVSYSQALKPAKLQNSSSWWNLATSTPRGSRMSLVSAAWSWEKSQLLLPIDFFVHRLSVEQEQYCRLPPSVLLPVDFRSTPSQAATTASAFAFLTVCYATRHFGMPTGILQTLQSRFYSTCRVEKMLSDRGFVGPLHLRPSLPLNDS